MKKILFTFLSIAIIVIITGFSNTSSENDQVTPEEIKAKKNTSLTSERGVSVIFYFFASINLPRVTSFF
jgi:uncharacterized protein YxeA